MPRSIAPPWRRAAAPPPRSTRPAKHRQYHHGALRQALLDAAAALAAERGAANVSLREVGRRAGVSHAAPYHHFADKASLMAGVAEEGFRRFDASQAEALSRAGADPRARFEALGQNYVRFALGHPHYFRVMFREQCLALGPASLKELAARTFDRLVSAVRALVPAPSDDREVQVKALFAWAVVHGWALLALDGPAPPGPPMAPQDIARAFTGLTAAVIAAPATPKEVRDAARR